MYFTQGGDELTEELYQNQGISAVKSRKSGSKGKKQIPAMKNKR